MWNQQNLCGLRALPWVKWRGTGGLCAAVHLLHPVPRHFRSLVLSCTARDQTKLDSYQLLWVVNIFKGDESVREWMRTNESAIKREWLVHSDATPWKYAFFFPCGHRDFEPAVNAQNDEFKDSFHSYSRLVLTPKRSQETQYVVRSILSDMFS